MRILIVLVLAGIALAAGGNLDWIAAAPAEHGIWSSAVVQDDGMVVVAGVDTDGRDFVVARYDTDGNLDPDFGTDGDGFVRPFGDTDLFPNADSAASNIALDTTGRILVLGNANYDVEVVIKAKGKNKDDTIETHSVSMLALVRLDEYGKLDTEFGDDGIALVDLDIVQTSGLAVQTNGYIVALAPVRVKNAGKGKAGRGTNGAVHLVRFDENGELDTSFGDGGIVLDNPSEDNERPGAVGLQSDGAGGQLIVVGGNYNVSGSDTEGFLARYESDGEVDTTFGIDGLKVLDFIMGGSFAIDDDDNILVPGRSDGDGILERYQADGSLDIGYVTDLTDDIRLRGVFVLPDGEIVACGETATVNPVVRDGFVLRLNSTGSLDTSFNESSAGAADGGFSDLTTPDDGDDDTDYDSDNENILGCVHDLSDGYVIYGVKAGDFFLARFSGN